MIKEGKYTLSELRAAIRESEAKNEFKPKLGDGVEKGNKKNNEEAVEDITKEVGKYNGEKMKHTVVLPDDRNKTTLDLNFNELKPGKEWTDRVEAQAAGYPSVENKKNSDVKDNGGLDYEGNEEFFKHREKLQKNRKETIKDDMDAGLKGRELKKYNVVNEDNTFANNTFSGENDFSKDYRVNASKFAHDGADAFFARKDQDRMHKNEKERKRYADKQLDKIANQPLGLNKDLNEDFDMEDDYMTTPDTVAKDFIRWATTEADRGHNYPINAMQLVYDAYVNNDQEALEDVATAYFEAKYTDMGQWENVMKGVEKAVNAFGYYNLSNEEENSNIENNIPVETENDEIQSTENNNNGEEENTESEPLDENKKKETRKNMKRLHYKKTAFLTENQMLNMIPEEYKTDGNKFYVKDASGTEYLVECTVDRKFDFPTLTVVSRLNENKTNGEIDRMKHLFGYESSNYFTKVDKKNETLESLHEQLEKSKGLIKVNG